MNLTQFDFEIILTLFFIGISCALLGNFLILRQVSLIVDAIAHSVLLGVVLMFFIVKDLDSIWLIAGVTITSFITIFLIELLIKQKGISKDIAIAVTFPFFLSLAILLITKYAYNIHLDIDKVLIGEVGFIPFQRLELFNQDYGPYLLWINAINCLVISLFIFIYYRKLKLTIFDKTLAHSHNISPQVVYYSLMFFTCITIVIAFETIGMFLALAFIIIPPTIGYFFSKRLINMIIISLVVSVISCFYGYRLSHIFDTNIASTITLLLALIFVIGFFLFSKQVGFYNLFYNYKKKHSLCCKLLLVHLLEHRGKDEYFQEATLKNMEKHMKWTLFFSKKVVFYGIQKGWLKKSQELLYLTELGTEKAKRIQKGFL